MDGVLRQRLSKVEELINTGVWTEAYGLAEINILDPVLVTKARAWFQLALVAGLCGNDTKRSYAWSQAKRCRDYTLTMEGDFYRDEAIILLKRGRMGEAQAACNVAKDLHEGVEGNRDRLVALIMVEGRIELGWGHYSDALSRHRKADHLWGELGEEATHQWKVNNLFHWLIAAVMNGHYLEAQQVFQVLVREEQNPKRKTAARFVLIGGKPACRLLLLLQKHF